MSSLSLALLGLCAALLVFGAVHDIIARTIPDAVPAGIALAALVLNILAGDLFWSFVAALSVMCVSLLIYWLRLMGGGDAKLFAAIGFLLPPAEVLPGIAAIAIAGGVLALLFLALRPGLRARQIAPAGRSAPLHRRALAAELWRIRRGGPLPSAVAISAGALFTMISSG